MIGIRGISATRLATAVREDDIRRAEEHRRTGSTPQTTPDDARGYPPTLTSLPSSTPGELGPTWRRGPIGRTGAQRT